MSAFTTYCRTVSAGYYCVRPGDTLDSIAQGFGQKPQDVARWNDVSPGTLLLVGQMLRMAPPDAPSHQANEPHAAAPHAAGTVSAMRAAASAQFVWPVSGVVIREFGEDGARGIEIAGRAGMPIKAAAAGRVVYAGDSIKTYGLMVIIKHEDGFVTAYGNNRRLLVREGDAVQRGAPIAEMGTQSNGEALLQFEMREGNQAVDPLAHLPADSGPVIE
ncbi:peptidoglycan DD-metalloendopeptidase family protein [Paraburkholderia oxyphila]|uniref:peptidoglycan DD-metalloendopeptidase family protein n=1 Tax=Paraburkholderia oxyphila TaxID=614212 RepID=UPI001428A23F|nr:peptidoglycan DD-metalloendopeptidase family protein [Paraburkholderia oxyphila]